MNPQTYSLKVRRRRGEWHATVPGLPGRDAPTFRARKISNLPADATVAIAAYLGVDPSVVHVSLLTPTRQRRRLLTPTLAQAFGGLAALGGVYLIGGVAATLMTAGVVIAALGVLRESGRI